MQEFGSRIYSVIFSLWICFLYRLLLVVLFIIIRYYYYLAWINVPLLGKKLVVLIKNNDDTNIFKTNILVFFLITIKVNFYDQTVLSQSIFQDIVPVVRVFLYISASVPFLILNTQFLEFTVKLYTLFIFSACAQLRTVKEIIWLLSFISILVSWYQTLHSKITMLNYLITIQGVLSTPKAKGCIFKGTCFFLHTYILLL